VNRQLLVRSDENTQRWSKQFKELQGSEFRVSLNSLELIKLMVTLSLGEEIYLHSFLNSALDGGESLAFREAALTPERAIDIN
jgi:hypothetical protein